jgi:RNA polymerase sigma factor (sigma-70 family)
MLGAQKTVSTVQAMASQGARTPSASCRGRDVELLEELRAGSTEAFAELYRTHWRKGLSYARRQVRQPADAADLCAVAFEQILVALRNGRGPTTTFDGYLCMTIHRAAWAQTASTKNLVLMPTFDDDAVLANSHEIENEWLGAAVDSLSPTHRRVLWLTEVYGYSPAEVAAKTGQTANGVAAQAYRARQLLKSRYLRALDDEEPCAG